MSTEGTPAPLQLPLVYSGAPDEPIPAANHFNATFTGQEFFLILGQVSPPPLIGTPEEQREQVRKIPNVSVRILGQYALSPERMVELRNLLTQQIDAVAQLPQNNGGDE